MGKTGLVVWLIGLAAIIAAQIKVWPKIFPELGSVEILIITFMLAFFWLAITWKL